MSTYGSGTYGNLAGLVALTPVDIAALQFVLSTWRSTIYADNIRVVTGLNTLVTLGIITEQRKI